MELQSLFLCCDWGTSSFRLRLFSKDQGVLAEVENKQGVARIAREHQGSEREAQFREILQGAVLELFLQVQIPLIELPEEIPILCSGMSSSSIGWQELPYAEVSFSLDGSSAVMRHIEHLRIPSHDSLCFPLYFISGVASESDVMRGEEVQLIGALTELSTDSEYIAILPGTHSKHCSIKKGALVSFQTFMTGECYKLLATHSVLQHSVDSEFLLQEGSFDTEWFYRGMQEAASSGLLGSMFKVRARSLRAGMSGERAAAYLSGMLLGAELAYLKEDEHKVVLLAGEALFPIYSLALKHFEIQTETVEGKTLEQATCIGQVAVYESQAAKTAASPELRKE